MYNEVNKLGKGLIKMKKELHELVLNVMQVVRENDIKKAVLLQNEITNYRYTLNNQLDDYISNNDIYSVGVTNIYDDKQVLNYADDIIIKHFDILDLAVATYE